MKKIKAMVAFSLLSLSMLGTSVHAAPQIGAQSIIVNPLPTDLSVNIWADRDAGGYRPTYYVGDRITLHTSVNEDAYVYLFDIDAVGVITQIYPNQYTGGHMYMRAGHTYTFPSGQDQFTFDVGEPRGLNRVLAIASRQPLNLDHLNYYPNTKFLPRVRCHTPSDFGHILGTMISPIDQSDWVSAIAYFNVR